MKKRYKLVLLLFISFILTLFIYKCLYHPSKIYVSMGSDLNYGMSTFSYLDYINDKYTNKGKSYHIKSSENVADIYSSISSNVENCNYYINNARLITIGLGSFELGNYSLLTSEIKKDYLDNIKKIIIKIKELTNANVILIDGNSKENNLSNMIKKLCEKYDIEYISIYTYESSPLEINGYLSLRYTTHINLYNYICNQKNDC